jgi:primary-amine oxidase
MQTKVENTAKVHSRFKHPLDPLTSEEVRLGIFRILLQSVLIRDHDTTQIVAVTSEIRKHIATNTEIKAVKFFTCSLLPAPKRAVLAYLGIPLEPGAKAEAPVPLTRRAEVDLIDAVNGCDHPVRKAWHII